MTRLQHVQRSPHIPLAQPDQTLDGVVLDPHALLLGHPIHQRPDVGLLQRAEAEARAARQQRGRQLVRVVCDDAEARVGRVLFHDAPQRHLRRVGHGVGLVEHDELEGGRERRGGRRFGAGAEDLSGTCDNGLAWALRSGSTEKIEGMRTCKGLDLLSYDVDATVVTCVELEDHLPHVLCAVYLACQGEDGRRFTRAWRAIKQEVWQSLAAVQPCIANRS